MSKKGWVWLGITLALLLCLPGCKLGTQPVTQPTTHARVGPGVAYPPPVELGQFESTPSPQSVTPQPVTSPPYPPPPGEETESVQHIITEIYDLTFINRQAGWLVGSQCSSEGLCSLGVRVTQDGGKTWLPSPAPAAGQSWRIRGAGAPQARYIRFANQQDGWIYGPGFFSSHDGGFTWFDETESRQVLAVEVSHGNTWVIQRECAGSEMCRYSLLTSSDNGYTWSQPKTLPNLPSEKIELIRRDENTAWLLSAGSPDFGLDHYLAVTSDGGSTWRELHVPCAHEETAAPHIAEVGGTDLWIICARPAEGNQQEKIISHSKDGGTSWARIQSLPTGGTLDEFMMLTPQRGLASLEPSTLLITGDSGHSWEQSLGAEAFPSPTTNLASAGGWACFFLDAQYGWVALHNVLFQTSDGGKNWSHQNVE